MSGSHSHSYLPPSDGALSTDRGIRALKVSLVGLMATAALQAVLVSFTGSAALLADTVHNCVDAFSALPLWFAFAVGRRKPTKQFTYGYDRFEDIAGLFIVLLVFATGIVVGYESIQKIRLGTSIRHLEWVAAGSIIGFLGNEAVARYRIKVGRAINSAALIADGQHARADAVTSLGVLAGTVGVWLGFPLADPAVGLLIAFFIFKIGWDSGHDLFERLADAIPPQTVARITEAARRVPGVRGVEDVRARYVGHNLRMELTIIVDGRITVHAGHDIAIGVQRALQEAFPGLISPAIHVDPEGHSGEAHHFDTHHHPSTPA